VMISEERLSYQLADVSPVTCISFEKEGE
jgi:hypothetical protein